MSRLSAKVKGWLDDARPRALAMIEQRAKYHDALAWLMFFYTRATIARFGRARKAAMAMQVVGPGIVRRYSKPPSAELSPGAMNCAEQWSASLSAGAATFREALFVFKLSLMQTAIEQAGGSRADAAKMLGVHRNTLWQKMPNSPADIWPLKKGKSE